MDNEVSDTTIDDPTLRQAPLVANELYAPLKSKRELIDILDNDPRVEHQVFRLELVRRLHLTDCALWADSRL